MSRFFAEWEDDAGFLSLLRAATTSEGAAAKMLELFRSQVYPALAGAAVDCPAALVGSQMLGLDLSRYVFRVPPLVAMSHDELRASLTHPELRVRGE